MGSTTIGLLNGAASEVIQLARLVRGAVARAREHAAAEAGQDTTEAAEAMLDGPGVGAPDKSRAAHAVDLIMRALDDPLQVLLIVGAFGASVLGANQVFLVWALFPAFFLISFVVLRRAHTPRHSEMSLRVSVFVPWRQLRQLG